ARHIVGQAPAGTGARAGTAENRYAPAHRRPDHRLQRVGGAARGPGSGAGVLVHGARQHASEAASVLDYPYQRTHARAHTRRPGSSHMGPASMHPTQLPCRNTHTTERTHEIIRGGLDRSPMYTGVIEGVGPRYCPSIEDKIHRFADKTSHQVFLEPEGLTTNEF